MMHPNVRLVRAIIRLYPQGFRERFGAEMLTAYLDQHDALCGNVSASRFAAWKLAASTIGGLLASLPAVHLQERRQRAAPSPTHANRSNGSVKNFVHDIRYAVRSLRKQPGFTAVAILTLALGIGANTAVFSVLNSVVLARLPYPDPAQLVRLYSASTTNPHERQYLTVPAMLDVRDDSSIFRSVGMMYIYSAVGNDLTEGGVPYRVRVLPISAGYFETLGATPLMGRTFSREEERAGVKRVILSHSLWSTLTNRDPNAVGRSIQFSGEAYEVIGVMRDGFRDVIAGDVAAWTPQTLDPATSGRGNHFLSAIARLAPGVSLAQAQARIDVIQRRLRAELPDSNRGRSMNVVPMHEDLVGESTSAVYVLMGAAGLVLLIACLNVANLFLARSVAQTRETAIRTALGARRSRLIGQRLTESLLVAVAGGIVGSVVAYGGVKALLLVSPESLPRAEEVGFDPLLLAFALATTVVTGVLFGAAPAFRASRVDPIDALHEGSRGNTGGRGSRNARSVLVASQVAVALVLLVGAGVLMKSFVALQRVNLGFDSRNVATFVINLPVARYGDPAQRAQLHHSVLDALRALPGVEHAGATSWLPGNGTYHTWGVEYVDPAGQTQAVAAQVRVVEGDFFPALKVPVVAGRTFTANEPIDTVGNAIMNKALATRVFGSRDPLGKTVRLSSRTFTIVGVVGDVAFDATGTRFEHIYLSHTQFARNRNWSLAYVVRTNGVPASVINPARRALATIDPALVLYQPRTMDDVLGRHRARQQFTLLLMAAFAAVALSLAAVGIYGVLSYAVTQRTHEIGVRMALGAQAGQVRAIVVAQGVYVAGTGVIAGLLLALALSRLLQTLVFGISPRDPFVFGVVTLVLAVVVLAATYLPARRATRVDPLEALRGD